MKKIKEEWQTFAIIVICVLLEIVLSNMTSIGLFFSGCQNVFLDTNSALVSNGTYESTQLGGGISLENGEIEFTNINSNMKNICITLRGNMEYVPVTICFTDDNFALDGGYNYNTVYTQMYAGNKTPNYYSLSSYGSVKSIKLIFDGSVTVSEVKLNAFPSFHISIFRLLVFLIICFVVKNKYLLIRFNPKKHSLYIAISAATVCVLIFVITAMLCSSNSDVSLLEYTPSSSISSEDQYRQLFEAFSKGQLNLDIDYDTEALGSLDNVYDRSERNEANMHGDFWDRAYYNGKFYSYFGVAPVFTVYFPVYFLTHCAPSTVFASILLCIYAVIFISLLYNFVICRFCRKVPVVLAVLGYFSILFTSGIFAITAENMFYYMAVLSGIAWTAAFMYFLLKAYYSDKVNLRIVFLILAGISVVLIAASRPTLLIYVSAVIVPAAFVLSDKTEVLKNKVLYAVSFAVPVSAGAILIMLYNYLRFENPLEFGFNYQLTVSIARANTVTLSMLPATVYHYFLQQPKIYGSFPYIEIKNRSMDAYSRYTYIGRTMGVLNYPVIWGLFFYPFTFKKSFKFKNAFLLTVVSSALVLSFIDMCKAGVHYRYTTDILFPLAIAAVVVIFDLLAQLDTLSYKHCKIAYAVTSILMMLSTALGYLMIFANENQSVMENFPYFVEFLRAV